MENIEFFDCDGCENIQFDCETPVECKNCPYGYESEIIEPSGSRPNSYKIKIKNKQRLKKLADESHGYPHSAYRVGSDRKYTDDPEQTMYVKREWRGKHSAYLKKLANKKVRRCDDEIPNGCAYKRIFDYWWELT